MHDNEDLFDPEDTIVLTKQSIKFFKNVDKMNTTLTKKLEDLDGKWELINTNYEEDEVLPDEWLSKNQDKLKYVYDDIIYKSKISTICDKLNFPLFMNYMQETSTIKFFDSSYINWDLYEEYKLYNMKKPDLKIWTSFFIEEIFQLYNDTNLSTVKLGKFEDFILFCFQNSSSNKQLPGY